jgi:hypothetical protein
MSLFGRVAVTVENNAFAVLEPLGKELLHSHLLAI